MAIYFMRKCWASILNDCEGEITREHIISDNLLNKTVITEGLAWCKDSRKEIGASNFTVRHLCKKHNNSLSVYDSEIKYYVEVFKTLYRVNNKFNKYGFSIKKVPIVYKISGKKLEKWFFKTMLNIVLVNKPNVILDFEKVAQIIFSDQSFEKPYGLSWAVKTGQVYEGDDSISFVPIFRNENELVGCLFDFLTHKFVVLVPNEFSPLDKFGNLDLPIGNAEDFDNLQINWHNKTITTSAIIGRKRIVTQRLEIEW
ncbi:hypothetical protein QWY31_15775 [Cytophagales bacterium LB-30]|uniref:HNH endonuclease n=1 Tax=Shiella aurantiaca TaxID=3058365 RepID=A0ABT8F997_9BACT|nr:hypothetical protein [Shiella aurantiaca]MDN4166970.1 hypothetical protein [Shiella aurantiaca]